MRFKFWQNLFLGLGFMFFLSLNVILMESANAQSFRFENLLKLNTQSFSSEWIENDDFTGLVLDLNIRQSGDDVMVGWVRFWQKDGKISEWVNIHNDVDSNHIGNPIRPYVTGEISNLINTNLASKFQVRYDIYSGPDSVLPMVELTKYETINAKGSENIVNKTSLVAGLSGISDTLNIISRSAWGANDNFNVVESYTEADYETVEKFRSDPYVRNVVIEKNGNLLSWPLQYSNNIKFLVVHHTATVGNLDNPRQAIRNIQQYHAVTRGWGDIGYNYIIDQQGNIYEGRDGGKSVIGGHTTQINKVSVGVALLGNYQEVEPSEAALQSLTKLLSSLAKEYNLDVSSYAQHEGKSYPVLGGHYNFSATACPGIYGKKFLPIVRNLVESEIKKGWQGFEATNMTSLGLTIDPKVNPNMKISPTFRNTSGQTWNTSNTYMTISHENKSILPASQRLNLVSDTANNNTARFEGNLFGNAASGYYEVKADLYVNNQKRNTTPIVLSLYIKPETVTPLPIQTDEFAKEEDVKNQPSLGVGNPYAVFFNNRDNTNTSSPPSNPLVNSVTPPSNSTSASISVIDRKPVSVNDPNIRILISRFDKSLTNVITSSSVKIEVDGKIVANNVSNKEITVWKTSSNKINIGYDTNIWEGKIARIIPTGENDKNVSQVLTYENRPNWNNNLNDNKFRGTLEFFLDSSNIMRLINELGIESYLLGLAEVPDNEPLEKVKTIIVAARSYAYYYSNGHGKGLKFKGFPYHLDDSPDSSQKYLGYGFEERNQLTNRAVEETIGEVITWFGYDVVIPYFSQSDGRTRTPKEVWGWSNFKAPYLTSVNDSFCMGGKGQRLGHGVGISGCGATEMARQGFKYNEIIDYYLKGVKLTKRY